MTISDVSAVAARPMRRTADLRLSPKINIAERADYEQGRGARLPFAATNGSGPAERTRGAALRREPSAVEGAISCAHSGGCGRWFGGARGSEFANL